MTLSKKDLEQIDKRFKRHVGVIYEKFQNDMKALGEGIDINREKIEANAQAIESNAQAIEANAQAIEANSKKIDVISQEMGEIKDCLGQKSDQKDLDSLEGRVVVLEDA